MQYALESLLPRIIPHLKINKDYYLHPHNGKSDLLQSIKNKINEFACNDVKVIILHDQDSNDCKVLKYDIQKLINKPVPTLIRIVCRELESWYLGDMDAIEKAYPRFKARKYKEKSKYRNPDKLNNASEEISKIVPEFQKIKGAKEIAPYIDIDNNKSPSFKAFVSGLKKFI